MKRSRRQCLQGNWIKIERHERNLID